MDSRFRVESLRLSRFPSFPLFLGPKVRVLFVDVHLPEQDDVPHRRNDGTRPGKLQRGIRKNTERSFESDKMKSSSRRWVTKRQEVLRADET